MKQSTERSFNRCNKIQWGLA